VPALHHPLLDRRLLPKARQRPYSGRADIEDRINGTRGSVRPEAQSCRLASQRTVLSVIPSIAAIARNFARSKVGSNHTAPCKTAELGGLIDVAKLNHGVIPVSSCPKGAAGVGLRTMTGVQTITIMD
jgi:hypothetical protein